MSINIKNRDTERAVRELVAVTGETQAAAIEVAAKERIERLRRQQRHSGIEHLVSRIQASARAADGAFTSDEFTSEDLYDDEGLPT